MIIGLDWLGKIWQKHNKQKRFLGISSNQQPFPIKTRVGGVEANRVWYL